MTLPAHDSVDARGVLTQRTATDEHLVALWLHGRSPHTQRAYRAGVDRFLAFVATSLPTVTLGDLQAFADALERQTLTPSSRVRTLAAVKSLLAFGQRTGYLPLNVGAALKLPPKKDRLAARILSETPVHRLLALEPSQRNQVLLRLLYTGGLRASELPALRWRDLQPRDDAGRVTIFGKRGKTRVVLLPVSVWHELAGLGRGPAEAPVFRSRRGGHLDPSAVERIVQKAATRAGIVVKVSPHWLRHAPRPTLWSAHLVQATLAHASVATTGRYLHARPTDSSARYLVV